MSPVGKQARGPAGRVASPGPTAKGKAATGEEGASLRPSDHGAGGLLDDADVTLVSCRFVEWDYQGKIEAPVLALEVKIEDEEGQGYEQYFSYGDLSRFRPSEDGTRAIPVGSTTTLNSNTNGAIFLTSIVNAGFPEDKIGDDVSVFDGMFVHVNRVAQPKRAGLVQEPGTRDKTVLTVTKIHRLPWEKAQRGPLAKGATGRPGTAPRPAAAAQGTENAVDEEARAAVQAALEAAGGEIPVKKLAMACFRQVAKDSQNRSAIINRVTVAEFLEAGQEDGLWATDGETVAAV